MRPNRAGWWIVPSVVLGSAGCGGITDASELSSVAGTVVNVFSEAPLADVSVRLVESGEFVVPDRTISSTTTAADGTFSFAYDSEDVRCDRLFLVLQHDEYGLAAGGAVWWFEGMVQLAGCSVRGFRPGMVPKPVHVALSPLELTVPAGERATFDVAVHYVDGTVLSSKRRVAGATFGLVSMRPNPTWESLEECGIAAHHDGEDGVYDAPESPPPASCGAEAGAVWVWGEHPDGWDAPSDSVLVRVLPR